MQNYAVVRNLKKGLMTFSDHQGGYRTLEAFGSMTGRDIVKIMMSDDGLAGQIRHYSALQNGGEIQVTFSSGIEAVKGASIDSNLTVHSTAEVTQRTADLVAKLRKDNETKKQNDKNADARLAFAKAKAVADGAKPVKIVPAATADDAVARSAVPADDFNIPNKDDGVELTAENLGKMDKVRLYEIAAKMGLKVRPGSTKGGIVKAILLSLN